MYYKGHGSEVKVHIMLLFLCINNCWARSFTLGHWSSISLVFWLRWGKKTLPGKILSHVSMHVAFLPFPMAGRVNLVTVGIYYYLEPACCWITWSQYLYLLPLRMYGPMRSTHNALQEVVMTSFGGTWPYSWLCLLFIWQDLQDLMYDQMVLHIPFQYTTDLIVSLRHDWPGCWSGGSGDTNWLPSVIEMLGWLICHCCVALLCLQ
jgi:hypothetical protein